MESHPLYKYYVQVQQTIIAKQHPCSGLLPASTAVTNHGNYMDAWVRDNVYSILAVWGLASAYGRLKQPWARAPAFQLRQSVVKLMRGLLQSMMRQAHKVESFKQTQALEHALHAKFDTPTGDTVVGDHEWGHLQIDATSLFVLQIAQMTASGITLIYTQDEVDFVQNLVYYIERAYRTPDYGIWERGNKMNSGRPEVNSSSVGMASAALEAINNVNLFGADGGPSSVIHVLPDEQARNKRAVHSKLPRESMSKEVDAACLSVISYPAFAVTDLELAETTRRAIVDKLQGRYGCKRFLKDGHQCTVEDTTRLNYTENELQVFQDIECEWPLFFTYLLMDAIFREDEDAVTLYKARLEGILLEKDLGHTKVALVPELYYVPADKIDAERANPRSQDRLPNENVPLVWAQSLYILCQLLMDEHIELKDIDPLERHSMVKSVPASTPVQVVFIATDRDVQDALYDMGVNANTCDEFGPTILPASRLRDVLCFSGKNEKMGLSGRPTRPIGTLGTCCLYTYRGTSYVFFPTFTHSGEFYLSSDTAYMCDVFRDEIAFVAQSWTGTGLPTMWVLVNRSMVFNNHAAFQSLVRETQNGVCNGFAVVSGDVSSAIEAASEICLDFLPDTFEVQGILEDVDYVALESERALLKFSAASSPAPGYAQFEDIRMRMTQRAGDGPQSLEHATSLLASSESLYEQVVLLDVLLGETSLDHAVTVMGRSTTVGDLAEELYNRACRHQLWLPVRAAAAILGKVPSISKAVDSLLTVVGSITVGFGHEFRITEPLPPLVYQEAIAKHSSPHALAPFILELITYLGSLARGEPDLFVGLSRVRVHPLIETMRDELARQQDQRTVWTREEWAVSLTDLLATTPSKTRALVREVLSTAKSADRIHLPGVEHKQSSSIAAPVITRVEPADRQAVVSFSHADPAASHFIVTCSPGGKHTTAAASPITITGLENNQTYAISVLACTADRASRPSASSVLLCGAPPRAPIITAAVEVSSGVLVSFLPPPQSPLLPISLYRCRSHPGGITTTGTESPVCVRGLEAGKIYTFSITAENTFGCSAPSARSSMVRTGAMPNSSCSLMLESLCARDALGHSRTSSTMIVGTTAVDVSQPGLHFAVVESTSGTIAAVRCFDLAQADASLAVLAFLRLYFNNEGAFVAMACTTGKCQSLPSEVVAAMARLLGANKVQEVMEDMAWCLIGPTENGSLESVHAEGDDDGGHLHHVITVSKHATVVQKGQWAHRRLVDGALARVPADFYSRTWEVLCKCTGIRVGTYCLPRDPVVSDMTPGEIYFAAAVDAMLDSIEVPAEHQIIVEACHILAGPLSAREHALDCEINLSDIVECAKRLHRDGLSADERTGDHDLLFADLPQDGENGSTAFLKRAIEEIVPQ